MFAIAFSLIAALSYGIGDFFGALASRKLHPLSVSLVGHSASSIAAGIALLFIPSAWSTGGTWSGVIAGACEAVGFLVFYYVLAVGPVAIVAPMVSVIYAIVPVAWAVCAGSHLTPLAAAGVALGLASVVALSVAPKGGAESDDELAAAAAAGRKPGINLGLVLLATIGGVTWGFATVALDMAPTAAGASPAVAGALTALGLVAVAYVFARGRIRTRFTTDSVRNSMLSGGLFGFANAFILLALATGALALVGLLTAMYPLATVLLARFALKEHISRVQWFGIAGAVTAAALMSIG